MPGNIGWQGLIVILIVLLIIFGPKRLPELGRSLGRGLREFKSSVAGGDDDEDDERVRPAPAEHEIGRLPPAPLDEPEQPREPQRDTVV
ncbi:MAG: twin-arginine translocase TatA/TatE family subunit [Thermoleophilia bacterium]|nr:twin-arginine translocase TatA/TatE family subunit [Thermoleophilia bacterium]